jgi:hypothetical protein
LRLRALVATALAISAMPLGATQALARLNARGVRLYDTMPLPARALAAQ